MKIRAENTHNLLLKQRPRSDLGRILSKNFSNRLIRLVQELAKLVTETSNKMHKSKTYNKAINNLINGNG